MTQDLFKLSTKRPHLLSLLLLCSFAAVGATLIAPSLPMIATYFGISNASAKLTVTTFLIGYAMGQLIYGPLANRYGRKIAYYIGILLATAGSILSIVSASSESFYVLLFGRFFEALGMSAGLVVTYTVVSDFYYPHQSRRIISYLTISPAIAPPLSMLAGGFLAQYFDWYIPFVNENFDFQNFLLTA